MNKRVAGVPLICLQIFPLMLNLTIAMPDDGYSNDLLHLSFITKLFDSKYSNKRIICPLMVNKEHIIWLILQIFRMQNADFINLQMLECTWSVFFCCLEESSCVLYITWLDRINIFIVHSTEVFHLLSKLDFIFWQTEFVLK